MSTNVYYHLCSTSMIAVDADDQWYKEVKQQWLCTGCGEPLSIDGPRDVYLASRPDSTVSTVSGVPIGLITKALLEALGKHVVNKCLHLGNVFDEKGKEDGEFLSFVGKESIDLRGGAKSTFRICEACSRPLYYPIGKRYLLAHRPPHNSIFESQFHQLIVTPDLAARIRQGGPWKHLALEELPVLDHPLDGRDDLVL